VNIRHRNYARAMKNLDVTEALKSFMNGQSHSFWENCRFDTELWFGRGKYYEWL
jgi:hypothetical protein